MATYDVRIVTASYRREPRNGPEQAQLPVIQLFGRTREGQSITIEYSGFQPYFFVVEPPQSLRGAFGRDPQVVKLEDVNRQVEGVTTPRRSSNWSTDSHPTSSPDTTSTATTCPCSSIAPPRTGFRGSSSPATSRTSSTSASGSGGSTAGSSRTYGGRSRRSA